MESILYEVMIDGTTVAERMSIEHAMIFIENLFNHYYNDTQMLVSIKRMERVTGEGCDGE